MHQPGVFEYPTVRKGGFFVPPGFVKHPRGLFMPCSSHKCRPPPQMPRGAHSTADYEGLHTVAATLPKEACTMTNPRYANGNLRRKHR